MQASEREISSLVDIVTYGEKLVVIGRDVDRETIFDEHDEAYRWAIYHGITVLGEATRRLSRPFRTAHPEIPWDDIVGMRDRIVHGYDRIRDEVVWDGLTNEIPVLIAQVGLLIEQVRQESP